MDVLSERIKATQLLAEQGDICVFCVTNEAIGSQEFRHYQILQAILFIAAVHRYCALGAWQTL